MWTDEAAAARIYTASTLRQVILGLRLYRHEPPGWYVLVWGIDRFWYGGSTLALTTIRWVSVVASLATLLGVFVYGQRLLDARRALVACAFVALGSQLIVYGTMARGYALFAALAIWFAISVERALDRATPVRLATVVALAAAGVYTHYFFLLTVMGSGIHVALRSVSWRRRLAVAAAVGLGTASLVPWLMQLLGSAHARTGVAHYFGAYDGHRVVDTPWNLFTGYLHVGRFVHDTQILAASLVAAGGLVLARRQDGRQAVLAGLFPVVAAATAWVAGVQVFDTRNFLGAAPFLAILASAPLAVPSRYAKGGVAVIAVAAMAAAFVVSELPLSRTSYDDVARALTARGWNTHPPVVFFGRSHATMKVVFTSMAPGSWMIPGSPPVRTCPVVDAVIETAAGRTWLKSMSANITHVERFPFYGAAPEGARARNPIAVVELRDVPHLGLVRARAAGGMVYLRTPVPQSVKGGSPPAPYPACLS